MRLRVALKLQHAERDFKRAVQAFGAAKPDQTPG